MYIGVNKLKLKNTKNVKKMLENEMQKTSAKGKTEDEVKESLVRDQINQIYNRLNEREIFRYNKDDIMYEIQEIIRRKNIKLNQSEFSEITNKLIYKELINRQVKDIYYDRELGKLSFSLLHQEFDLQSFRGEVYDSYQELYFSASIEVSSPFALVFINSSSIFFPKIRKLLKPLLYDGFHIQSVEWNDEALRAIAEKYGGEIKALTATGIEGFIRAKANANEGLNATAMKADLDRGSWISVKFTFKDLYPSNFIQINGRNGYLSSDLSDDDLKYFTKNHLMHYSS
jgi:hypothetical protein